MFWGLAQLATAILSAHFERRGIASENGDTDA
jgi:hypothetical protein